MPKVSVVIPVYNTSKYLRQCLDSLLNQTLEDFEVICVNDESTDNSLEILKEYAQKDSRFIVIDKENEGQGIARNIAIEKAQGEYLLCLDSDDWLENNALELAYNKFIESDSDILFFDAYRYIEKKQEKYLLKYTEIYKNFKNKPFTPKDAGKILLNTNGLPFKMYQLNFIKENKIKYLDIKFMEDVPFYIKAMILAKRISCISIPLYNYRVLEQSATFNYKKYLTDTPKVCEVCFEIVKKANVDENIFNSFLENRKNSLLYFYDITPFHKKYLYHNMAKDIIKKHFSKYPLDEQLEKIVKTNFFTYFLNIQVKILKYIFKTYNF